MAEIPEQNPFQSPATSPADDPLVTTGIERQMQKTRPWVLLLAVFGVLGMGIMLLGLVGILINDELDSAPGLPRYFRIGLAVGYGAVLVGCCTPLLFMFKFASRINRFVSSGSVGHLEAALSAQKSLWKSAGIVMLAFVAMYAVMIGVVAVNAFQQAGAPLGAPTGVVVDSPDGEFDDLFD